MQKVAPFLTVDGDPYPIVNTATGHIQWIVDGYTTMANFPYSERQSLAKVTGTSLRTDQKDTQINYIRNSVKAVVDAYDGTVTLYQWDAQDPVLKAWMKIFPGLVKPKSDMPAGGPVARALPAGPVQHPAGAAGAVPHRRPHRGVQRPRHLGRAAGPVPSGNQPPFYVLAAPPGSSSNSRSSS